MSKKYFNEIVHGTEYYRAPTPLPAEWEYDIPRLADFSLGMMQIRINWRWNERREGEYDFTDVDRLMELAEENGVKVVIKFLLECAPQYVYDKYGGTRIGPRGEAVRGGSHGAFYGGWRPCFTNPDVQRRASLFVEEVAKRYAGRKCLVLWNAWNEIRNKPFEDCFCPHCRQAFGRYLKGKFGTVESLNSFYGVAEESFENIALPSTPHGFWDIFEFKKFKGSDNLYEYLKFVYDAIRKHDTDTPVMSHVGFCAAFQYTLGDVCDDWAVSKAVDFFGTSIPCDTTMNTEEQRLDFMMLNDYMRSVDNRYFLYEIYPGLGMFKHPYDTPYDMKYKLYSALGAGAKGLVYWQYRAERVGHENDCAGIVRADGSPREVAFTVRDFGEELKKNTEMLADCEAIAAEAAIVFDFNSMLLSEIEDFVGPDFEFNKVSDTEYYRKSHAGFYRLMSRMGNRVDYLNVREPEKFTKYKVLYFPYYNMYDESLTPYLEEFVRSGGVLLCDEGFGLREMNTWMQPYDIPAKPVMTARIRERRKLKKDKPARISFYPEDFRSGMYCYGASDSEKNASLRELYGRDERIVREVEATGYTSEIDVEDAFTVARFESGAPAMQLRHYGDGVVVVFGFSLGYSAYESVNGLGELIETVMGIRLEADYGSFPIEKRRLRAKDGRIIEFLYNTTELEYTANASPFIQLLGGDGRLEDGIFTLPPRSFAYVTSEDGQPWMPDDFGIV